MENVINIFLDKVPRLTSFPWRVCQIGYLTDFFDDASCTKVNFPDKLEFCLRFSSESGPLRHWIGGVEYNSSPTHLQVKLPRGEYRTESQSRRDVFYIVYPSALVDGFRSAGLIDETLCWDVTMSPETLHLVTLLRELMARTRDAGITDRIDMLSIQLIHELVLTRNICGLSMNQDTKKIDRIASYLQLHVNDDISIDEVSEANGFSRSSFFRRWEERYGMSPGKYVAKLRIAESKRLLAETTRTVADISRLMKFSSPAYFCCFFKKHSGMTPQEWRNSCVSI